MRTSTMRTQSRARAVALAADTAVSLLRESLQPQCPRYRPLRGREFEGLETRILFATDLELTPLHPFGVYGNTATDSIARGMEHVRHRSFATREHHHPRDQRHRRFGEFRKRRNGTCRGHYHRQRHGGVREHDVCKRFRLGCPLRGDHQSHQRSDRSKHHRQQHLCACHHWIRSHRRACLFYRDQGRRGHSLSLRKQQLPQ